MKKSFYHPLLFLNRSISLVIIIVLFSGIANAQSLSRLATQSQFDPQTNYPLIFLNPQAVTQPDENPVWVTIQSVSIPQQIGPNRFAKPVTLNLDQVRNGSADDPVVPPAIAPWVNGNAGASNAHYVEGYSIPYRMVMENLVGNSLRSVDIEWDTRHSGANAIDFITNFDLIDYPAGSHFFNFLHDQEVINPLTEDLGSISDGDSPDIPKPTIPTAPGNTFDAIQAAGKGKFGIWGADITGVTVAPTGLRYITQGVLTGAQSSTRLRIYFTNTGPTVIISWGGHIAKGADWGAGNSASAVSGSPYHTRLIEWDPQGDDNNPESVGNQDRSLSADAVLDPPKCNLQGPTSMECNSTSTNFTSGVVQSDLSQGVTFEWSIPVGSDNASFCGTSVSSACVQAGSTSCGSGTEFTVRYRLLKNGTEISRCNWSVDITDNTPPTILNVGSPSTIDCPASPSFSTPTATDACTTPTLTSSDGTTNSCGSTRSVTRTWTARDACNNTATASQTITVRDITPPVISSVPIPSTINCPAAPSFANPTASDACGASSITSSDASTAGSCANSYSTTRTWTATDACGNTATKSQTITVVDNTAPVISSVPVPSTINCPATPSFAEPTASDACGASSITSSDATVAGSCANNYSKTRTWTATDACGNTATKSQTITVVDNAPPVISGVGDPQTINCPATPSFSSPTASDACGASSITSSDGTTPGSCPNNYSVKRTWTATDACGKTSTASQTITVRDITPPVITCPPDATVDCNVSTTAGTAAVGSATATDACGPTTVNSSDQTNTAGCRTVITRTWTARDACGNTATCVQYIIKKDLFAPTITCNVDGSATASDNCTGAVVLYLSNGTWTAIDESGNISTKVCPVGGGAGRLAPTQITAEQKEQQLVTEETVVTEEKTKAATPLKGTVQDVRVQAIPNPFSDRVKFLVTSSISGNGSLEVYNMTGQKLKTVYTGYIAAGTQTFELSLPTQQVSNLVYVLRIGDKKMTGKILQINNR